MAKVALDLSQFKSAGVYTVEVDQSERIQVTTQSLRLVPGFSSIGPYNAPVFIQSTADLTRFYGPIDTKLERKGSFFHRSIETCLLSSPVFAINLLNVNATPGIDNYDVVDFARFSIDSGVDNGGTAASPDSDTFIDDSMYVNFFNKERFWKPSEDYLQGVVNNSIGATNNYSAPLFSLVNVGTRDLTFVVRKAVGLQGYSVPAIDWYGNETNIPYEWIRPNDLISDYFIQIVAIEGKWDNYKNLSSDPYYSQFFSDQGLIPSQINNFINAPGINLVGSWTGSIIPDFKDQTGSEQYIETILNGSSSLTGVYMNINQDALDQLIWDEDQGQWEIGDGSSIDAANYLVDLVGHNLSGINSGSINKSFLSYDISINESDFHTTVDITQLDSTGKKFTITDSSTADSITVGSLIKSGSDIQPSVTYVTNKTYGQDSTSLYTIETADPIDNYTSIATEVIVQKPIDHEDVATHYKMIALKGLHIVNRHTPGFTTTGEPSVEEGVKKIYGMLHDDGILRGLTNPDMIQYRYVVDTMAYGLQPEMGGKAYLSSLAKKRGKCTAILSAPSIKQFSTSQNPYFSNTFVPGVDPVPIFDTKWIPMGGNPDMPRGFKFSLPSEDFGSRYCGVFGPFLRYTINGKDIDVPPAADVSNSYVRKFLGGDPYAIVANRNGILSNPNIAGVEYMIDQQDRDYLEPFGYNSIIERPTSGQVLIYANATAFQTVKSDYNNLHVRELLNTLELQIDEVLKPYVFDYNNPVTRLNIVNSVAPILETAKDAGAIIKYDLVMNETNNSESIIKDGFGILDIQLWVTGALTKIIARYTVNSDGGLSTGGFTVN